MPGELECDIYLKLRPDLGKMTKLFLALPTGRRRCWPEPGEVVLPEDASLTPVATLERSSGDCETIPL